MFINYQPLETYAGQCGESIKEISREQLEYELANAMDAISRVEDKLYDCEKFMKNHYGYAFIGLSNLKDIEREIANYYTDSGRYSVKNRMKHDMIKNMPIDYFADDAMNGG